MKKIFTFLLKSLLILTVSILVVVFLFIKKPNQETLKKLNLIKTELSNQGYHNRWFVISGHRTKWYNSLLKHSAKKSYHLKGKAIDIFVIDIDGDWDFDSQDIKIIESINKKIEKSHPNLIGAMGTYTTKDFFTKHTVHLDTRGYKRRYNM